MPDGKGRNSMNTPVSSEDVKPLSVEDAAAMLLNVDYIPPGFTLLSLLEAFCEEAEIDRDEARATSTSELAKQQTQCRLDACTSRFNLAELLIELLRNEVELNPNSPLVASSASGPRMIDLSELADWAADRYGISIPTSSITPATPAQIPTGKRWADVTIKIQANHRIAYSFGDGKWRTKALSEVDLLNRRLSKPNHQAVILIGLAQGKRFPPPYRSKLESREAKAISLLRKSLVALTGLERDDPITFNTADGYRPAFTLIDDRGNADQRAKDRAIHDPWSEDVIDVGDNAWSSPDFEDEDDAAGRWLEEER